MTTGLLIGLASAVAAGFFLGWSLRKKRGVSEMARFEGRLEELQGQLVRERRAHEELKVGTANGGALSDPADDLCRIKGIGSVLKDKLHDLGITTFQQIADLTPEDVERIDRELDFPGRVEREDWIGQAKKIIADGA